MHKPSTHVHTQQKLCIFSKTGVYMFGSFDNQNQIQDMADMQCTEVLATIDSYDTHIHGSQKAQF